jgi:hypothetical protein
MSLRKWLAAVRDAAADVTDRVHAVFDAVLSTLTALAGIARALWPRSPIFTLKALAFVLGIAPLSYYGYMWMTFKPVKQMTDCRNDLYTGVAAARGTPQQQLDAIETAFKRSFDCNSNVDPRISNLDFAKQQRQRWRDTGVGPGASTPRR